MNISLSCVLLFWLLIPISAQTQENPQTDYHEHLLSPAVAKILGQPKPLSRSGFDC